APTTPKHGSRGTRNGPPPPTQRLPRLPRALRAKVRPRKKPGRPDGEVALVCRAGWAGRVGTPSTPNLEPGPHNLGRAWKLLPLPSILIAKAFGRPSGDNHTEKLTLYTCLLFFFFFFFFRRLSDGVSQRDAIDFRALEIEFQPARPRPRSLTYSRRKK
ncbi:mCG1030901, partial [Mus musculus]